VGIIFLAHGYQKLFLWGHDSVTAAFTQMGIPFAGTSAWLAALTEFIGGLALVGGLLARWAALPLAFTMLVAIAQVHLGGGFFAPKGFEYPLALLAASVAIAIAGPGAFALDNLLRGSRTGIQSDYALARN